MNRLYREFNAMLDELENIRQWLINAFQQQNNKQLDTNFQQDILIAVTEIFVNFVKHSQLKPTELIQIQLDFAEVFLTVIFKETGESFDVTTIGEPDLAVLHESGYGIFIVKNLMDSFEYFPKSTVTCQNITKITKGYHHGER